MTAPVTVQLPLIPETPPVLSDMTLVPLDRFPPDEAMEGQPYPRLIDSVRRWGVLDPVLIRAVGGALDYANPKTLVAGRRRIKTARLLVAEARHAMEKAARASPVPKGGDLNADPVYRAAYERWRDLQRLPVRVVSDPEGTLTDGRTEALAVMTNAVRQDNPATDFRAISFLVARFVAEGLSERAALAEVASATGLAPGTVKQRLRLLDLSPALQDDFMAGRLPYSVALQASRLGNESQTLFAQMLDDGERATLELVKQAKRDAVKQHQQDFLGALPDPPEGPVPQWPGAPGTDGLLVRAEALAQQLGAIKMPITQEAASTIEALLDRIREQGDG
jgi:ParB-like chromosome segregation protein Spo0J